jgi:hypothetical protein
MLCLANYCNDSALFQESFKWYQSIRFTHLAGLIKNIKVEISGILHHFRTSCLASVKSNIACLDSVAFVLQNSPVLQIKQSCVTVICGYDTNNSQIVFINGNGLHLIVRGTNRWRGEQANVRDLLIRNILMQSFESVHEIWLYCCLITSSHTIQIQVQYTFFS